MSKLYDNLQKLSARREAFSEEVITQLLCVEAHGFSHLIHETGVYLEALPSTMGQKYLGHGTIEFFSADKRAKTHTGWAATTILDQIYFDPNTMRVTHMTAYVPSNDFCMPCVAWDSVPLGKFVSNLDQLFPNKPKHRQTARPVGKWSRALKRLGL